ncbi:PLP-dependent aminotransferase family protein [Microbacterium sp. KSW4-16]|uniref:MocR-like transcription factor YczR n=1 Tax=Microbacterium TaxID=33882 RepID=UPI00103C22B4|nr:MULTISPECIES: PLP-dependent aminotransferase family protein [Microbacterium]MCK8465849.1 PLP-dependent aminotransferase family protein [Microbacterium aurugineum]TCJ29075.1 PLP-dependent aminotransferase family protein [Microbacterium sp. PI-1]
MGSRLVEQLGAHNVAGTAASVLADRIRALVLDGRLTVGERLPSERALARELRRSRSTITRAYGLLEDDGYVTRLHGGSTRVALPHDHAAPGLDADDTAIDLSIASMDSTPGLYDATVRSLPRLAALRGTSGYSLQGLPELRDAVAQRFRERGAPTSAEEIIITSGALNAVNLILTAIGRRGERALVEQPTFPHALEALHRHGYRLVPTPVDVEGWDTRHLNETLLSARPHVAYLIPDFHNPTGATLPDEDRQRIVTTSRNVGTHLIVDETTTELDIDRGWSPTPMAASGPNVITVGSMSKIAWGGMRIGWIRAERSVVARLLAVRPSFELGTALLEQCIAIELLTEMPALTSHVGRRLRAGRAAVEAGVAGIPGWHMPRTPGGLSAWVDIGGPLSTALSLAARERQLILPPGPRFTTGGVLERRLRLPITLPPDRTAEAMTRLALAWEDVRRGTASRADDLEHAAVI